MKHRIPTKKKKALIQKDVSLKTACPTSNKKYWSEVKIKSVMNGKISQQMGIMLHHLKTFLA